MPAAAAQPVDRREDAAHRHDLRKGWCPGALRPMAARDGLLVRLRIAGGIVPAASARTLADLADRYGNGRFDLSARGNLQIRGVGEGALPDLHAGLSALGLLDADADGEAVRNVLASPLAGLHKGFDIRPLVVALEARLAGDATLHDLPAKFGFLVDDGSAPSLAANAADVRFDFLPETRTFAIGLGGHRPDACRIGDCEPDELVARAAAIAFGALKLGRRSPQRGRMRHLVEDFGIDAVARACDGTVRPPVVAGADPGTPRSVGHLRAAGAPFVGLGIPFGRLDGAMLRAAAYLAADAGIGELRLTPWRALFVPAVVPDAVDLASLGRLGFIVDADDPRLAVVACVGRDGCAQGTTPTREDAAALAALADRKDLLHVSGCEKGCANPGAASVTLVGRGGRYDLVRDGRASDAPVARGLDLAAVAAALAVAPRPA